MKCAINGIVVEMTPEEIDEVKKHEQQQIEENKNRPPTLEDQIESLKKDNEALTQCILEMSMLVYQ